MNRTSLKRLLDGCFVAKRVVETLPELPSGMKPRHIHVMDAVYEITDQQDSCRVGEVSARLGITTPSVTKLIQGLETLGMVQKYADPKDKRAVLVKLTAKGQKCIQKHVIELHDEWANAMGKITDEQVEEVCEILEKLRLTMPGQKQGKDETYDRRS